MPKSLNRDEAIEALSRSDLANLTEAERAEQLEIMVLENWESHPLWPTLPSDVRQAFEEGGELEDPADRRFDPALMLWLRDSYLGARNAYLLDLIRAFRPEIEDIEGIPMELIACPCCGYQTLGSRGNYEICRVCWWEDDGQDNDDASVVRGVPNYHVSLTRGRVNFLKLGIYDPAREDLRRLQEPPEKYVRGREFVLDASGDFVVEPAAGWRARTSDDEGQAQP